MFCEVITLRKNGLRLRPDEWPEPIAGRLYLEYWQGSTNNHRRCIRSLDLLARRGSIDVPALRMADAELVDIAGDGMLLRGVELRADGGRVHEHVQMWLVRPRHEKGTALPPFDAKPWVSRLPEA